jgi:hypothetical protein
MATKRESSGWGWLAAGAALLVGLAVTSNRKTDSDEGIGSLVDELIGRLNTQHGSNWGQMALDTIESQFASKLPPPWGLLLDIVWQIERASLMGNLHKSKKRSHAVMKAKQRGIKA